MGGLLVKSAPVGGVGYAAGTTEAAAAGTKVVVYAMSIAPAAAAASVILSDGGSATPLRWVMSAAPNTAGSGNSVTFSPPLLCPNGMRVTVSGVGAIASIQWSAGIP